MTDKVVVDCNAIMNAEFNGDITPLFWRTSLIPSKCQETGFPNAI